MPPSIFITTIRRAKRSARSDPVTPADNPKSGNAFSAGTCPRRCNFDLETNRILARTAIASRIARLHARPGPLRGARGTRRRWGSRLCMCASVRRNGDNGQGDKFHERFHGHSPISAWLRPAGGNCACQPTARRSSTQDRPSSIPDYRRCHFLRSSR